MSASLTRMVAGVPVGWGRNTLTVKRRTRNVWSSETLSPATESRSPCPSRNYPNLSTNTIARNLTSGLERYSTGLSTSANRTSNTGNNYCSELSTSAHISSSPVRRYSALSTNITASKSSSNSFNNCTGLSPTTSDPRMNCATLSTESTISKPMPRSAQNYTGLSPATNRSTCPRRNCVGISTSATASRSTTSPIDGPWVSATPRVCLHDVPTTIQAGGLPPNAPVTLAASLIDENGKQFVSHAHYVSDEHGDVNITNDAAYGGSYSGVFPAGLLTTLSPAPHEFPYLRLYRRDPFLPWKIVIGVSEGHNPLMSDADTVAEVVLERQLVAPGVQRIPIHQGRVRGALYLPQGQGPFPGVIDMFGTAGGLMEFRAAMLASRGIATLALAYFAYDDLPKNTNRFELEYFEEAVNMLLSQEGVIPDRCGVVATSKATDIAYCIGTWLPQVKAVVCISGTAVALDNIITYKGKVLVEGYKMGLEQIIIDEEGRFYPSRDEISRIMKWDHPKYIPFHQADDDTYFLMVGGSEDGWSSDIPVMATRKRMDHLGRGDKLETVVYPGAGHILEPPYHSHVYQSYQRHTPVIEDDGSQVIGVRMLWGGRAKEHCSAQEDLWLRMRTFITKHVRDSKTLSKL